MTHQDATSVVTLPVEQVYAGLSDVEAWPKFLLGVAAVRRTAHERYVFTVADAASRTRDVEVAVGHHPAEHRIAWHALSGAKFDGEIRMSPVGEGHTRVHLQLVAEPAGFLAGVAEMVGATVPAAMLDLQRMETLLGAAES